MRNIFGIHRPMRLHGGDTSHWLRALGSGYHDDIYHDWLSLTSALGHDRPNTKVCLDGPGCKSCIRPTLVLARIACPQQETGQHRSRLVVSQSFCCRPDGYFPRLTHVHWPTSLPFHVLLHATMTLPFVTFTMQVPEQPAPKLVTPYLRRISSESPSHQELPPRPSLLPLRENIVAVCSRWSWSRPPSR